MSNSAYPEAMEELMELLRGLPGVGRRSAERIAMRMYQWDESKLKIFGELLCSLKDRVGTCPECGGMSAGKGCPCAICSSPRRDRTALCVVEEFSQMRTIESGGVFHGVYHVLGGRLAPLEGKLPDSLSIAPLLEKVRSGVVREVILALSPDVEGQATAVYLADLVKDFPVSVTRLAQGLPAGSDLAYADAATVAAALTGRTKF